MALLLLQVTCLLLLSLFTLSTSLEDNPSVITKTDRDILSAMRTTFTDLYNQENVGNFKQFAVMYYGTSAEIPATIVTEECKTQAGNKVFLDDIKSDFDVSKCTFIAGKLKLGDKDSHTEKWIFKSLEQAKGQVCPGTKDKNVYLFTHNSPCVNCKDFITDYMTKCKGIKQFKRLIVGYTEEFSGVEDTKTAIKAANDVAITKLE